jgi:hypothetical protein
MSAAQVQLLESFDSRITTVEGEIQTKADIVHAHSIADIDGLQAALDGKSDVGHTHSEYALVNHRHQISDIDGLSDIAGNVALTADVTVIGTTVGAAGEGTVFPTGMTFQQFVEAISTKLAHPTYVAPSIVISSTTAAGSYEYGTALNLTFSLSYHQRLSIAMENGRSVRDIGPAARGHRHQAWLKNPVQRPWPGARPQTVKMSGNKARRVLFAALSVGGQEVAQHGVTMLGQDGFRVKLHALDRQGFVAHAHDFAVFCPGGD